MSKKALHEVNRYHDPAFPVELFQVTQGGILPPGRGRGISTGTRSCNSPCSPPAKG